MSLERMKTLTLFLSFFPFNHSNGKINTPTNKQGFIAMARLDPTALGLNVVAFIHVAMEKGHIRDLRKFTDIVVGLPQILECYSVTGDFDYVVKVVARDLKALSTFLMETLMHLPGVNSVRSSVCLDEVKCTSALPMPD